LLPIPLTELPRRSSNLSCTEAQAQRRNSGGALGLPPLLSGDSRINGSREKGRRTRGNVYPTLPGSTASHVLLGNPRVLGLEMFLSADYRSRPENKSWCCASDRAHTRSMTRSSPGTGNLSMFFEFLVAWATLVDGRRMKGCVGLLNERACVFESDSPAPTFAECAGGDDKGSQSCATVTTKPRPS